MMKKECIILIFIFLLLSSSVGQVCAATTVFLTSDNIMGEDNDKKMLNSIKNYVEELSNGEIHRLLSRRNPRYPSPGRGNFQCELWTSRHPGTRIQPRLGIRT